MRRWLPALRHVYDPQLSRALLTRYKQPSLPQTRQRSSLNRLLFERDHEETRPLIPDAILSLPRSSNSPSAHISVALGDQVHNLPHVYLRDSCGCPKCVDPSTTQKTFNTGDIKADIRPTAQRIINNSLEIIWDDGHRSVFPAQSLSDYLSRSAATQTRFNDHTPITWKAGDMALKDISVSHKSFMTSDSAVYQVVSDLTHYGLAFIQDCPSGPSSESHLSSLVERIGPLKNTFYGSTWNVRATEQAKNVAYTNVNLDLHMDLLYYESPPGLQFLHCLENGVSGGASIFVDSFRVAEEMRHAHPREFETLCRVPVDFKYRNDGVYYHQSRTTFVLNGETGGLEYVNYAPPFQGTQVPQDFEAYHRAISVFARLLAREEYRSELVLKAGQCVIFNNRRTLHARTAFGPGKRWLKGAYCDIDALWSKYRTGRILAEQ